MVGRLSSILAIHHVYVAIFGPVRGNWIYATSKIRSKAGRRLTARLPGSDIPLTMRAGGSDILVFNEIFVNYEYEWGFGEAPRVIVDAGGYIGLSAAFFANKYPDATIIAIEPDEENFALLKSNTARFPNVRAVHAAVWGEHGKLSLIDPGIGNWGLQVTDKNDGGPEDGELVTAVTIGDIIEKFQLGRIDLLKMDVEGSEIEIFATADSWISSVDTICIELHDRYRPGCSRSFFGAVADFPIELRRNEDVLVARSGSRLAPAV